MVSGGKKELVILLSDGSRMAVPRSWTDADGVAFGSETGEDVLCAPGHLRVLVELVDVLKERAS